MEVGLGLHSLGELFRVFEQPTGSRDPFALRRSAIGALALITHNGLRFSTYRIFEYQKTITNLTEFDKASTYVASYAATDLDYFFADRLKVQQREAGVRHDLIDAVFALGGEDDLVRLLARVKALQAFVATEDGANLLAGYRRAANIVRIEAKKDADAGTPTPPKADGAYVPEPAEAALAVALNVTEPAAAAAVAAEDFEGAMQALARLRPAVDAFFDQVTVNDPERDKRTARLALLDRIRVAVHKVADFSKIEG